MLVPYLPNPTTSGGQTRWYYIIKYLAIKHEITLFCLIKDDSEKRFIPELKKYCKKVSVFPRSKKPWTLRNIILSQFGPYPLLVVRNWSLEERRAVKRQLAKEKFDLIHTETFYVMPHLTKTNIPTIQVEQTMWHEVYKHHVEGKIPAVLKPFFMLDVYKVKFWEKYYWRRADKLVAVSEEDKEEMQRLIPEKNVEVIPNGVDADYYAAKKVERRYPPRVLYGVTNFEWLQNQEATEELIKNVWPYMKRGFPSAKIWIVGRKIPEWLKEMARKNSDIEITENIPDARDAYRCASIMVAPIRGAGGTRLKILEAMAAGLPVISTSIGVAGLGVKNEKNVMIADSNKGLAEKAIQLLKNPAFAEKIGESGREHVRKYFDWKPIIKLHDRIYKELLKDK